MGKQNESKKNMRKKYATTGYTDAHDFYKPDCNSNIWILLRKGKTVVMAIA